VTPAEEEILEKAAERAVRASARLIVRAATNVIYIDPHKWSDKPCATCRIVTGLFGFEFGCDRYRLEKKANGV